ncbi:DUF1850 domain-containing protein [Actinomadura alba]|uniref:DUF1850 domain-containing protein n=1 Tax=Actinomadura alba TaxID=406431 RepID=A0ABR7LY29_9ACTN|nr:DUF1850 domain-containing protein [Actinomadura alba]MBC6469375.1 DUF1850 domain-containing protein [Actinomadura alba]
MRRPALWGRCVGGALLLGCAAVSDGSHDAGEWSIVAERAGGSALVARPPAAGGSFALAYEHSAYRSPAVELFAVAGQGFTMYALASTNEAVLDYYDLEGTRTRLAGTGWWVLRPAWPRTYAELSLIATPLGRRTLVAGSVCLPLYPRAGAYDLRIRVMRTRPTGRTAPCPPAVREVVQTVPLHDGTRKIAR